MVGSEICKEPMPTVFLVRAVVAENLRDKFDHWYSTDHLPWTMKVFKCQKAWRFWSGQGRRHLSAMISFR